MQRVKAWIKSTVWGTKSNRPYLSWAAITGLLSHQLDYGRPQLWLGAFFICGAAVYFSLSFNLDIAIAAVTAAFVCGVAFIYRARLAVLAFALVILSFALGVVAAGLETQFAAAPRIINATPALKMSGEVSDIETGGSRRPRVLVKVTSVEGIDTLSLPEYVRATGVNLRDLRVGDMFSGEIRLKPFPGPTHPGGYNPAFKAYFNKIGAIGTIAKPVDILNPPERSVWEQIVFSVARWREAATRSIIEKLPGDTGAIAASLVTGDRAALSDELYEAFNGSGLMHVLSISGLHMVLVAGGMFFAARFILSFISIFVRDIPVKKLAAIAALIIVTFYEIISGGAVATTRSYIMILIVFGAVLLDRPALTMRNVVLAALLIAAVDPHEIIGASFQMSFAATAALIAAHERKLFPRFKAWDDSLFAKTMTWIVGAFVITVLTSVIAELATAPFTLHHFHRISLFGIIGNVLALVFIELAIMPGVLLTLLFLPFGLEGLALPLLGFGVDRMVDVANWVSSLPGALSGMSGFGTPTLVLCSFALCWACFWRGRIARLAIVPYMLGLGIGMYEKAPDIYISPYGSSIAARQENGALSLMMSPRETFSGRRWLENDGDRRDIDDKTIKQGQNCDTLGCTVKMKQQQLLAISLKRVAVPEDCINADILILPKFDAPSHCSKPKVILDRQKIVRAQGMSITLTQSWFGGSQFSMRSIAQECGARPWCAPPYSSKRF